MTTLLQINAGLQGADSHSSRLADQLVAKLKAKRPALQLIKRDLSNSPIPHLDQDVFRTFSEPAAAETPEQLAGLALSDCLIAELKAAETLVLGAPMYNLMIPSQLKSWLDYVTRAGHSFQFTETGPQGLLKGKTAYVVVAQGGNFLGSPADLVSRYLEMALGLIGITAVEFIYAQGLALGPQAAEAGLAAAQRQIEDICAPKQPLVTSS